MWKGVVIGGLIILILGSLLTVGIALSPTIRTRKVPYEVQIEKTRKVPYEETVIREQPVHSEGDIQVPGGYFVSLPPDGVYISLGKTFVLSWSADGTLNAYIFTELQFEDFKPTGVPRGWEAFGSGKSGTISASIAHSDKYYAVIYNPYLFTNIKLYDGVAKLTWKEKVTKYRTETHYETETRYRIEPRYELWFLAGATSLVGLATTIIGLILKPSQTKSADAHLRRPDKYKSKEGVWVELG